MRDSVEFNTASFNSKDDMKQSTVIRIPPTNMPALYEVSNENEHFEDEADDISLHNSVASSEYYNGADDNTIIQRALERINRRSAPFYKEIRDKIDKQQQYVQGINDQRLPSSPQSQHMDDGIEIENTFGVKKFSQMVSRINYENKTPSKMTPLFSVSESIKADYSDMEESTMVPSPSNSKIMEASPKAFIKSVKESMNSV